MSGIEIAAAIAAVSTVAATSVSVVSGQNQGKQAKLNARAQAEINANAARDAANLELKQYEEQREAARSQAIADEAAARRNLDAAQASLRAKLSYAGMDPFGPTGRALLAQNESDAEADITTIWANSGRAMKQIDWGVQGSQMRARNTIIGATTGAASTAAAANLSASSGTTGAVINGIGGLARTGYSFLSSAEDGTAASRRRTP